MIYSQLQKSFMTTSLIATHWGCNSSSPTVNTHKNLLGKNPALDATR